MEYKELIGKKFSETDDIIPTLFPNENDMPDFMARSSDGKDFMLGWFNVIGFPKGWNDLVITDIIEEWSDVGYTSKKLTLIAIVDKTYDEVLDR